MRAVEQWNSRAVEGGGTPNVEGQMPNGVEKRLQKFTLGVKMGWLGNIGKLELGSNYGCSRFGSNAIKDLIPGQWVLDLMAVVGNGEPLDSARDGQGRRLKGVPKRSPSGRGY